jgi:hypothetical protein
MKSDGPWNLRGLRPEARASARDAARRSRMSVGEWLNTVICAAEDCESEPRRSARSERTERSYEPREFYSDDREWDQGQDRNPPAHQVNAEIEYDERGYDRHQKQEWERHSGGRRPTNRGEQRRHPSREETWERGFGDGDLNGAHHRQMSPRRRPEARHFRGQPERPREQYYDQPKSTGFFGKVRNFIGGFGRKSPQERVRDEPQDQRDRHRIRSRPAAPRERDEQWLEEDSGAAERNPRRQRHRNASRWDPENESEESWPHGNAQRRVRRRANPDAQRARDEDRIADRSDRDSERYREPPRPRHKRNEEESWRNVRQDPHQRKKSRTLRNREPDEDRFEDSNVAGEHYRERYRNPPRLAPEAEPETSSWERFSEEEIDRYFVEPSPEADGKAEDAERSNFDHEPDRAPRRRLSLEPEEPFETIPREGHHIRERRPVRRGYASELENRIEPEPSEEEDALSARRAKAERPPGGRQSADQWEERYSGEREESMPLRRGYSRHRADDSENLPPQRMRLDNREEHRQRRDTGRRWQGSSEDEQWALEEGTFRDESTRLGGPSPSE